MLDHEDLYVNSNRSLTKTFLFTTGSSTFSETNIYAAYCMIQNNETYGPRFIIGVTLRGGAGDFSYVGLKRPSSNDFESITGRPDMSYGSYTLQGGVVEYYYWIEEPFSDILDIQKGGYIFKAINAQGNEVYLKDYLNMPRIMVFPASVSPGLSSPTFPSDPPPVEDLRPQFQWQFLSDARVYDVQLQELSEDNNVVQLFISPRLTVTKFSFPFDLKDGVKYRWRVRAHDGEVNATEDNRSISQWRYFRVQDQ